MKTSYSYTVCCMLDAVCCISHEAEGGVTGAASLSCMLHVVCCMSYAACCMLYTVRLRRRQLRLSKVGGVWGGGAPPGNRLNENVVVIRCMLYVVCGMLYAVTCMLHTRSCIRYPACCKLSAVCCMLHALSEMEAIWHRNGARMVSKRGLGASRGPPEPSRDATSARDRCWHRFWLHFGSPFGSMLGPFGAPKRSKMPSSTLRRARS